MSASSQTNTESHFVIHAACKAPIYMPLGFLLNLSAPQSERLPLHLFLDTLEA